jgi:hypothetical protein
MSLQLGARRADGLHNPFTSAQARFISKVRTPVAHYSRSVVVQNRRLIRGSATSSEAESSQKQEEAKENDQIQETLAGLDALLGIEEEPEEVVETKKDVSAENVLRTSFSFSTQTSLWPSSPPLSRSSSHAGFFSF